MKREPQLLKGTKDFLPSRMIFRNWMTDKLRRVFESFGFEPLDTPAIEYAETLEGKFGPEADKLIYKFQDRGGRDVGLRYDLTVPLARVVAMNGDLAKPFKRFQIAPVWRAEKPQKGRYREFWQCDFDIVGARSLLADAEIVLVIVESLRSLGLRGFKVKVNHRRLLSSLASLAGVTEEAAGGLYRAIDKLDKIGKTGVLQELGASGIEETVSIRLLDILTQRGSAIELLGSVRRDLDAAGLDVAGVDETEALYRHIVAVGVPEECFEIDLSMVRGLDYYTGPIFETSVVEPKIGSISGGGRYDNLVGLVGNSSLPAVGASFGLDRLMDVMEALSLNPDEGRSTVTSVLVTVFDADSLTASADLARSLRASGENAELYLGVDKLSNQLRYASRKNIPVVAILGPDERAKGETILRRMDTGEQRAVPLAQVSAILNQMR